MSASAVSALQVQDLEASHAAQAQSVSSQVGLLGPASGSPGAVSGLLQDAARAAIVIMANVFLAAMRIVSRVSVRAVRRPVGEVGTVWS
jgi:hypothetical protein